MQIGEIGILTAFAAGIISFLSPCVLPLVPGYLSYVTGESVGSAAVAAPARRRALALGACFVAGFGLVFLLLGAGATALGRLLLSWRNELSIVGGIVIVIFGLFMLGAFKPLWLLRDWRPELNIQGGRPATAFVLGIAFGFGWTPCIGPILGAILTVTAVTADPAGGMALLGVYALGLGMPFLIVALLADAGARRLRQAAKAGRWLHRGAGAVLVMAGIAMATGQLTALSYWLLSAFPVLGRIG